MGIDAGFDLYPPIDPDYDDDRDFWSSFFQAVKTEFKDDPNVSFYQGSLVFEVGEHPSLPFAGNHFGRFSSKVSMRNGGAAAEHYVKQVGKMAKRFFGKRIYAWSEYGEIPNIKYSWHEVYEAQRAARGEITKTLETSTISFHAVAVAVTTAFEHVHRGMDGLRFVEASFPEDGGYHIIHEMRGLSTVSCLEDWTDYVQGPDEAFRAYWATRANNNCATLNGAMLQVLRHLNDRGISKVAVFIRCKEHILGKEHILDISGISIRRIGLTPHHVGTIIEPPCVSKVPPSPDGETFHEFLVGLTETEREPVALDCAVAQYGLREYNQFACEKLVPYLRKLGKHRLLDSSENNDVDPFVEAKVDACRRFALRALKYHWRVLEE